MVCKEEICTWFKNLSPHKRIDYMCGMLQMCLPMELRFLGSYVEDLAKKDFHQLRESEGKANNRHELSKFSETDSRVFRTKMAVYLALLHSSNRTCSNIIFQLLEKHVQEALTVIDNMDVMTVHNILLVLSMAMNHPAFSYHQKSRMYEYYRAANDASERILNKHLPEPELLILSESCDMRSCDQGLSPMCSPGVPQMHLIPSPVAPSLPQHINSPPVPEKVFVCGIDVKNSRQRDKGKNAIEYVIQVTWSDGKKKNVFKTYQELVAFHKKLVETFPEDMPKLPSIKGTQNHKKENKEHLNQYASSLSELPEYIRQTNLFASFFETALHRPTTDACTSPRPPVLAEVPVVQRLPNSGDEETVIDQQYIGQPPSQNLYTSYLSQSPISGDMCNLSPLSPVHHQMAYQGAAHSPSCSTKTTSPLISSPCHSPVSSGESLANSVPGSPSLHDREDSSQRASSKDGTRVPEERGLQMPDRTSLNNQDSSHIAAADVTGRAVEDFSISAFLKYHNMAHFADQFVGYTLEQVVSMRDEDIDMMGVPKEVVEAVRNAVLEKLRDKQPAYPNGLIEPSAQTGLMWHPTYIPTLHGLGPLPPLQYQHAPPGAYQQVFNYQSFQDGPGIVPAAQDMSPSNSEYSSPSPSPHLPHVAAVRKPPQQMQLTDSSSEDGERDKQPGQYRGSARGKGHSAPNSARGSHQEKNTVIKYDTNSNSGTPPLAVEKCDSNVNAGSNASSGYTSDPTFTRPLLRTNKAHPAHTTTLQPHSKVVVNMPEGNFKGIAQPFVRMMGPTHMRDITMTTSSGQHGFTMSPADLGHRSMLYFPQGQPVFARSHFNPVNVSGSRPIFHPAAAVNQSMVAAQQAVFNGNSSTGSNSKGFPGAQTVVPPSPLPSKAANVLVNGVDSNSVNQPQISDTCSHRPSATPAVVSSAASTSLTVTYTSSGQTVTTNRPISCMSCGCTGHHTMPQPTHPAIPLMPPVPTNMWHAPCNGLFPMHMQMQHLYSNHLSYPNGLNQELLYNHHSMYGISHSNNQGMAGVPSVIYSNYGNHHTSASGYSQKRLKKINCHNCGSGKHQAPDCPEVSMEAMSGHTMYSYKPKNESE